MLVCSLCGGGSFRDFCEHLCAREAELREEHVLALRLYTTACHKSLNTPYP